MREPFNQDGKKWVYVNEKKGFVAYRAYDGSEKIFDEKDNNKEQDKNKPQKDKIKNFWKGTKMKGRTDEKILKHEQKYKDEKEDKNNDKGGKK